MSKYLVMWESNLNLIPADAQERIEMNMKMLEATKQMLSNGEAEDWGLFIGGGKGYAISEGDATKAFKNLQQFAPYIIFNVQEVMAVDEVLDALKTMMG